MLFPTKSLLSLLLLLLCSIERSQSSSGSRRLKFRGKRDALLLPPPLVYPFGGTLKLLAGCAIPIAMPGRVLVYGQNFQAQFPLPQNASSYSDYFGKRSPSRRRRSAVDERAVFYRFLEDELQRRGGPGKDCLLRTICEIAETPLKDDGLVGEVLHVLLTPDYGGSAGMNEEYRRAAELGRRGVNCLESYSSCPKGFGILDRISKVFDYD